MYGFTFEQTLALIGFLALMPALVYLSIKTVSWLTRGGK